MRLKYIFTIIIILFFFSCFKKENSNNIDQNNNTEFKEEIDFDKMKELINKSEKIDIEVFFAISILHKNFIDQFVEQVKEKTEEEQKIFFEEKNKEFFKTLKYTEEEYLEFQLKNEKILIDYLNHHPELMKYLITIN